MKIRDTVDRLCKKYKTRNPYELIEALGIILTYGEGMEEVRGFYLYDSRIRLICVGNNLPDYLERFVAAHELGHVVHADSLDTRIKYTFYLSCMVALLGTLISLIRTAFSNPLFFIIGVLAGGFVLFSLSLALSAANIITFVMNAFSGKWQEFRADMYAVSLGYGVELMEFFGCDGWSFGAILSANDTFDRRTLMGAISDPHPSEKHRCLYLCVATGFLAHIPFTRYWRMRREG